MAKFEILTQSEYDKTHQLCVIEVTVDLGDDDVRSYTQDVIFESKNLEKKAQEYADELEESLNKQKEDGTLASREEFSQS